MNLFAVSDDVVTYEGKVFEAGEYPDKDFSIDDDELSAKARAFMGVDADLEHSEFKDLLGNRLGRLESIVVRGREAFGRLSVPRWLHELCGGKLSTSLAFDRDKNIVGCALTLSPRIADAQVAAAFAKFAGVPMDAQLPIHEPARTQARAKENPMSTFKDKLRALFGMAPDAVHEAGLDLAELETVEFTAKEQPIDPRVEKQLAEFKATNERLVSGQLHTLAAQFAEDQIRTGKAVPAQREHLRSLYKTAATADGQGAIKFAENGHVEEGANLKALRELFANAVPHSMFSTQIPNADPTAEPGQPDKAMVERLRSATALGQQTSASKKEAK